MLDTFRFWPLFVSREIFSPKNSDRKVKHHRYVMLVQKPSLGRPGGSRCHQELLAQPTSCQPLQQPKHSSGVVSNFIRILSDFLPASLVISPRSTRLLMKPAWSKNSSLTASGSGLCALTTFPQMQKGNTEKCGRAPSSLAAMRIIHHLEYLSCGCQLLILSLWRNSYEQCEKGQDLALSHFIMPGIPSLLDENSV